MIYKKLIEINDPIRHVGDVENLRYHVRRSEFLPDDVKNFAVEELDWLLLRRNEKQLNHFIRCQDQIQGTTKHAFAPSSDSPVVLS